MRGHVDGLIASPPCQDFSMAGKKAGITGDKGELMWEVPRWASALRPRWIACEQVPPAEAWFRLFAHDLRADGYSTWVGVLCAADCGVPQTRRRVFLLASLDRAVQPPEPTHCEGGSEEGMFTPGLLPWVTMADALGWEGVLCPGVTPTQPNRRRYSPNEPAPTVAFGHDATNWAWERPATTIVGSFSPDTVAAPGYRKPGDPPRQDTPGSVKITTTEAAILQGFPPDYPWQGSRTAQFQQIGNAVCPPVAAAVLKVVAA
jgi:DNA (cytosine-5)-methyltransferase 1